MNYISFFKKRKIKKKIFKKNIFLVKSVNLQLELKLGLPKLVFLHKKLNYHINTKIAFYKVENNIILNINQRGSNTKATINTKTDLKTFTIGSIIQYFKIKQGKHIRRSVKGVKIFLNFLKKYFFKKSYNFIKNNKNVLFIQINGFDFNLNFLKKNLKSFLKKNSICTYYLVNLKIGFTTLKSKRVKSIKKRLKKKILLFFLKNTKIKK